MSEGKREKEDDDGDDGVIALIRPAMKDQGNAIIYYRGRYTGMYSRSNKGEFYCVWQDCDGNRETMVVEESESEEESAFIRGPSQRQVLTL
jgi:hypothetical protein